jgi:hypothetical protein
MLCDVRGSWFENSQVRPTPLASDSHGKVPLHVFHGEAVFVKQSSSYSLTDLLFWGISKQIGA